MTDVPVWNEWLDIDEPVKAGPKPNPTRTLVGKLHYQRHLDQATADSIEVRRYHCYFCGGEYHEVGDATYRRCPMCGTRIVN